MSRPRTPRGRFIVQWPEEGQMWEAKATVKPSRLDKPFFEFYPKQGVRQACVISGDAVLCKDGNRWVKVGRIETKIHDTYAILDKWYQMAPGGRRPEPIG